MKSVKGFVQQGGKIFRVIDVDSIIPNPDQPRKNFDFDSLVSLAQSIKSVGVIQPLTVRYENEGNYRLISGERRLRACKMAGVNRVPCIVTDSDAESEALVALIENLQRRDLDFFEQAEGLASIIDGMHMSQSEVAVRIGKSQSSVANKLRLLRIPVSVRRDILGYGLTERHARALLKLPVPVMAEVIAEAADKSMGIVEFEKYTERLLALSDGTPEGVRVIMKRTPPPKAKGYIGDMRVCINTLDKTVKLLRAAGISAKADNEDRGDRVIYTVTIKK